MAHLRPGSVRRIGIVLVGLEAANLPALRFLILQLNRLQATFEYEFLPLRHPDPKEDDPGENEFFTMLRAEFELKRKHVRAAVPLFTSTYHAFLLELNDAYTLQEEPPDYFIVVSLAKFDDGFYAIREKQVSVLALGNWDPVMAPPSILESILTFVVRESIASISHRLRGSIHLGTKGCVCDFTANLDEARIKVLSAFVCAHCARALREEGLGVVVSEVQTVLSREWLGTVDDPSCPASIIAKLGYNLFATKGLSATPWERILARVSEEGVKQIGIVIGGVILAALLVWLGFKPK